MIRSFYQFWYLSFIVSVRLRKRDRYMIIWGNNLIYGKQVMLNYKKSYIYIEIKFRIERKLRRFRDTSIEINECFGMI